MQYRNLGSSGLEVSALAFGCWQLGDPAYWGEDAEADAQATIDVALDAGINLFDTADSYGDGESERVLGQLLGSRRDEVLIASKILPREDTEIYFNRSLKEEMSEGEHKHFEVKAKPENFGLGIGKGGRTIGAIRSLVKVKATLEKTEYGTGNWKFGNKESYSLGMSGRYRILLGLNFADMSKLEWNIGGSSGIR